MSGEEVLELGVEPVLRLPRLKVEKAEDQRAGEAEQRRRERNAHARDRGRQAALQVVEHGRGVGAGLHRIDHAADRMNGLEQTPEGAEQAEEDQQTDEIAVELATLVEPGADRIEDRARGGGRHAPLSRPGVDQRRHRPEQSRLGDSRAGDRRSERIDPADFTEQPEHLAKGEQRADRQHADDQAVQPRIGGKRQQNLLVEDEGDEPDQDQERRHADQEDARRGQEAMIRCLRHRGTGERAERGDAS